MAMTKKYIRLEGRSAPYFGFSTTRTQMFLAEDHVLVVRSNGMADQVARYYLEDIQAMSCYKTSAGLMGSIFFLIITVMFAALGFAAALPAVFAPTADVSLISLLAGLSTLISLIVAFFVTLLVGNIMLGPTCRTTLFTVSTAASLDNLGRLRTARKVLARISDAIESIQGRVDSAALLEQRDTALPSEPLTVAACSVPTRRQVAKVALRPDNGRLHIWFFVLLFLEAISHLVDLLLQSDVKNTIDAIFMVMLLCFGCDVLLRQRGTDLPKSVRRWTIAGVVYLLVGCFGLTMVLLTLFTLTSNNPFIQSFEAFVQSPYGMAEMATTFVGLSMIATFGLLSIARFRNAREESTVRETKLEEETTP